MELAKCQNCGKILHAEDDIFQIRMIQSDGQIYWGACCSDECAEAKQQSLVNLHMARVHDMQNQSFQKMKLHDFGR